MTRCGFVGKQFGAGTSPGSVATTTNWLHPTAECDTISICLLGILKVDYPERAHHTLPFPATSQ